MSETWYRVVNASDEIEPVEVEYSTEHFIMLSSEYSKGICEPRLIVDENCFPFFDDAVWYIMKRAERNLEIAQEQVSFARTRLARVEGRYHG